MKNKTLLGCLILVATTNLAFIVFLILFLVFEGKQPYMALFVTFLMFAYHLDVRFLSGAILSPFRSRIDVDGKSHRISEAEFKRLNKLKIKKWKNCYPTLFKGQFALKGGKAIDEVIRSSINAENVHWLCFFLGLGAIPLGCLLSLDELWLYLLTSLLASLLLDLPFVLIQRYNRYRLYSVKDMIKKSATESKE